MRDTIPEAHAKVIEELVHGSQNAQSVLEVLAQLKPELKERAVHCLNPSPLPDCPDLDSVWEFSEDPTVKRDTVIPHLYECRYCYQIVDGNTDVP